MSFPYLSEPWKFSPISRPNFARDTIVSTDSKGYSEGGWKNYFIPSNEASNFEDWGFHYQKSNSDDNKNGNERYNVVCHLETTAPSSEEIWCPFLKYQSSLIRSVQMFKISEKGNQYLEFLNPRLAKSVLDSANAIFCFYDEAFYGLLRASPDFVEDSKSVVRTVDFTNDKLKNRSESEDPYHMFMNQSFMPLDKLSAIEAASVISSTSKSESQRFYTCKQTKKPTSSYFRDQEMIYWQFKTFSLVNDLEMPKDTTFDAFRSWNQSLLNPKQTDNIQDLYCLMRIAYDKREPLFVQNTKKEKIATRISQYMLDGKSCVKAKQQTASTFF